MIKKTSKGHVVYNKDGTKKLSRHYRSRKQALKRMGQIEFFKRAKG